MAPNPIKNVDGPYGKPKITITNIDRDFYFKYNPELDIIQWSDYISVPKDCTGVPEARISGEFYTGLPIHRPEIDRCRPNPDGLELIPAVSVSNESWSDVDKSCFNLGLYLFDQDFANIQRFVVTKKAEDIVSYYEKVFRGSAEYVQWSERMKVIKEEEEEEKKRMMRRKLMNKKKKNFVMTMKKKKNTEEKKKKTYVEWNKVFLGERQRELISRLKVENLDKKMKAISKGKGFVLECALLLKDNAGIKRLVEAIAIGEGKKDLTRTDFIRPRSTNQVTTTNFRLKMPTENEWAKIKNSYIVKLLGCRLNSVRSAYVFWSGVWPRLLNNGWSSEKPDDKRCNKSLVFLVPGVKKFSRSVHKNGIDYFDSFIDVLRKVTNEPGLMDPKEDGGAERGAKEDTNDQELGPKQKLAGPVDGEAEHGAGSKDRNDRQLGLKRKQAGPVYGEAEHGAGKDRNDREVGRKPKQAAPVYGEAERRAREGRNYQQLGPKPKQAAPVYGEAERRAREDRNRQELGLKGKQAGPVYGEAERGAGKDRNNQQLGLKQKQTWPVYMAGEDRNDQELGRKQKQAGPVNGEAGRGAREDRSDQELGRRQKQAGSVNGEAGRGAREDRNDQELGRKQKQARPVDGEGPIKKRPRVLTAGKHDGPRNGGIGSSMSRRPAIGTSRQGSAWVESPPAGLMNGSLVANAHFSVDPTPDELRGARLLFDLNKLPQASDDSENDNEPIMPGNSNRARNDGLGVVAMNPMNHGTRVRPRTPKGKSYGDSTAKNGMPKK